MTQLRQGDCDDWSILDLAPVKRLFAGSTTTQDVLGKGYCYDSIGSFQYKGNCGPGRIALKFKHNITDNDDQDNDENESKFKSKTNYSITNEWVIDGARIKNCLSSKGGFSGQVDWGQFKRWGSLSSYNTFQICPDGSDYKQVTGITIDMCPNMFGQLELGHTFQKYFLAGRMFCEYGPFHLSKFVDFDIRTKKMHLDGCATLKTPKFTVSVYALSKAFSSFQYKMHKLGFQTALNILATEEVEFAAKGERNMQNDETNLSVGIKFVRDSGIGKIKIGTDKNICFSWKRKLSEHISLVSSWKIPFNFKSIFDNNGWQIFPFGTQIVLSEDAFE